MSVTLKYGSSTRTFDEVGLRGFDDPDEVRFLMFQNRVLPDGSIYQRIPAFKRIITLDLGVVADKRLRVWLNNFILSGTKVISYLGIEMSVDLEDPRTFANEFWDGCETLRYYVLRLEEKLPSVGIPVEFGTYVVKTDPDGNVATDPEGRPQYVWS
jgi:hypothetical protein